MSDEDEPAVELGAAHPVEGAPLARIASRLSWPIQKSEIDRLEGDSVVRTPAGPRELSDMLPAVDETYFDRRQTFVEAVNDVVGTGPIPTADE